jgi:hypothetical protein
VDNCGLGSYTPLLEIPSPESARPMKTARADFLFASPSALTGVARFFDLAGTFDCYNASPTENEADAKATFTDWLCVGDAFRDAITRLLPDREG